MNDLILERRYRRLLAWLVGLFCLTSVGVLAALAQHAGTYARADLIAACALWLTGLVALLLIFNPRSDRHYRRRPAERSSSGRGAPTPAM